MCIKINIKKILIFSFLFITTCKADIIVKYANYFPLGSRYDDNYGKNNPMVIIDLNFRLMDKNYWYLSGGYSRNSGYLKNSEALSNRTTRIDLGVLTTGWQYYFYKPIYLKIAPSLLLVHTKQKSTWLKDKHKFHFGGEFGLGFRRYFQTLAIDIFASYLGYFTRTTKDQYHDKVNLSGFLVGFGIGYKF